MLRATRLQLRGQVFENADIRTLADQAVDGGV
jgi:hypothetical protein